MAQSPRILLITLRPIAISPLPHPATLPPTIGPIALVSHLKRGQKIGPRSPLHNVLVSTRQSGLQSVLLQRRKGSETHPRMRVLQKEVIRLLQSVPTRRPDMVSARSIVTRSASPPSDTEALCQTHPLSCNKRLASLASVVFFLADCPQDYPKDDDLKRRPNADTD